ncbi:ATP-binding protein [Streptomyces sp. NPDC088560]|uniref:ATP-binding protein n=1 Tax=Streptomyces sp. NPDC088560 TaxID=3365868 RepID=UPI003813780E
MSKEALSGALQPEGDAPADCRILDQPTGGLWQRFKLSGARARGSPQGPRVRSPSSCPIAAVSAWGVPQEAADSVLLTVSELVTNAVEHAQPPLNLALNRDADTRRVHIEVSDGGPADREGDWAASGTPDEHGRGMDIIGHITAAHGEHGHPGHAVHWADVNATA